MIDYYKPKTPHPSVANFANSPAIGCNRRLGLGDFEPHIRSSRFNQHFPKEQ